jgi:predicted amidohydrolase YtcJ
MGIMSLNAICFKSNIKTVLAVCLLMIFSCSEVTDYQPDLILFNAKILTVDEKFSIVEALAIKNEKLMALGSNREITQLAGNSTTKIDLKGKTVLPGLIDAHLHPETASVSELDHIIPDVHTIDELLDWIKNEAAVKKKGEWIIHEKFFPTRLREMRQPSLEELDRAAPENPVFLNGTYGGMINSSAMRVSHITSKIDNPAVLRNPQTGRLSGFIQAAAFPLLNIPPGKKRNYDEVLDALADMIKRYNRVGITSLCSGAGDPSNLKQYIDLKKQGRLNARILQNITLPLAASAPEEEIRQKLLDLGYYTGFGDVWIRIGALKVWMDGGILTGTARLREPWGEKAEQIYGITDPAYRGLLFISKETLVKIGRVANEIGWKLTAHCTGGGAVDVMLDAFEEINRIRPIKPRRFSIIHGNFYTPGAIERMRNLGVYADMQPAWFYKDADAMKYVLGDRRILSFHPYKSLFDAGVIVNGGSDHMVKFDSYASINPYNPFLAMWAVITRKTEVGSQINSNEALRREQALRMYTINNAYASFEEDLKGSLEPGKLADLVVISEDFLTCPEDKIKTISAELTMVGGRIVYKSQDFQYSEK